MPGRSKKFFRLSSRASRPIPRLARKTGAADFIERHVPSVLAACGEKDEFSFLRSLLPFYQKARQEEKLKETKKRLLSPLPGVVSGAASTSW